MKLFSKKKKNFIIALVLILIILSLNFYQKEVKNFFYLISSPFQKNLWRAGERVSLFFETVREIKSLKKENEELKLKIKEILAENLNLKELKKENKILRDALNIGLEKEFNLQLVSVIGKDISEDFLIIDKGSKDGLEKNLAVVTQQKVLVGRISEVYENFSKVMLISNKRSSFDGKISGLKEEEIYGVVKGGGKNKINFESVAQDKKVREGDKVITSALAGIFPSGILVGEIKEVKKNDVEPFQKIEIRPAFDLEKLEFLFVIKK